MNFKEALYEALADHFGDDDTGVIEVPLHDVLSCMMIVSTELMNSLPGGPRQDAYQFMADILAAGKMAGEKQISIGYALAKIKGVHLN